MKNFIISLNPLEKKLLITYAIFSILLFFFSFTQVDLGLTLTRSSIFTDIQKAFQYIGFFNRPLSTFFYVLLIIASFWLYALTLFFTIKKRISRKGVIAIILFVSFILLFSYPLLSHDIFNYIFDAKILTHYHQNPYIHKALDYPQDPMLSFMHWTHRTYPYGPIWLIITLPFSFLGLNYFLPTFLLFKILSFISFILTSFAVFKIGKELKIENSAIPLVLFALNPIVIFEVLINGHNDLFMMLLSLLGIYFLIKKQLIKSNLLILLSIGVKFATLILLPLIITWPILTKKFPKLTNTHLVIISTILMLIPLFFVINRTNFQPWYLLFIIPFVSLLNPKIISIPLGIISLTGLLLYIPYLYVGNWDKPIPDILNMVTLIGAIISLLTLTYFYLTKKSS